MSEGSSSPNEVLERPRESLLMARMCSCLRLNPELEVLPFLGWW